MKLFDPEARKQLKEAAGVGALGIEMGLAIVVGYFAGRWLDGRFDTTPYLTWFGLLCGIGAAGKGIIRTARAYQKAHRDETKEEEPG